MLFKYAIVWTLLYLTLAVNVTYSQLGYPKDVSCVWKGCHGRRAVGPVFERTEKKTLLGYAKWITSYIWITSVHWKEEALSNEPFRYRETTNHTCCRPEGLTPAMVNEMTQITSILMPKAASQKNSVHFGLWPCYLSDSQVRELLEAFGPLRTLIIPKYSTNVSMGFAVCEYADPNITEAAIMGLRSISINDQILNVGRIQSKFEPSLQITPQAEEDMMKGRENLMRVLAKHHLSGSDPCAQQQRPNVMYFGAAG